VLTRLFVALAAVTVVACASTMAALAGGGAPGVETEHVSGLGRTGAVLNAVVNPNGSPVGECYFEYGTSESSLSSVASCSYLPGELETPVPVSATLAGLAESTTYYFRIHAKSTAGESSGTIRSFTTMPSAPVANTESAATIGRTGATFSAYVTPDDSEVTECFFEYGTVPGELSDRVACSPSPGAGSEPVSVHGSVSGLAESTVYYYRVVARNGYGSEHGGRTNFETLPSRPKANTEPAAAVAHTTATLRGFVTPNGGSVESCSFQWGSSSIEEHTVPCEQVSIGSGETPVAVTANLTGLAESTTYHFRLLASNSHGTGMGGSEGFTTLPYLPKVMIQRPGELSDESAVLRAKINPQDEAVSECRFEYGTTPGLGSLAPCNLLPEAGERWVQVSAPVGGLASSTTYLVRVRARDASGVTYSKLESFTTYQPGLAPIVSKIKPGKGSSAGGTAVTVKGENLQGATGVLFGEVETTDITADSPDSLTVIAPGGVGTVDVVVLTESGESATTSADRFTYTKPIIGEVSPGHGPLAGGTEVTVTGSGFEPGSTGTTFLFGKEPGSGVECASSTTCTVTTPAAYKGKAGTVKVTAKVAGKGSSSAPGAVFTYEG
jgi:phosphodiesterase/alkaline phosphatase D-like protein